MTDTKIRRQAGYTLIEILMALGLVSVILMASIFVLNFFYAKSVGLEKQTSSRFDLAVLEKVMFRDLLHAQPTFGNVMFQATDGTNFFELFGDSPESLLPANKRARSFVLTAEKDSYIDLIVQLDKNETKFFYTPGYAYGPSEPLAFAGLNRVVPPATQGFFSERFPSLLKQGAHFYLYSPALIRARSGQSLAPTRFYSFVGYFSGDSFITDTLNGTFDTRHPLYPNVPVRDVDTWLRWLPPIGGAMATVIVMPVQIIRYRLAKDPSRPGSASLYRSIKVGTTFQNETLIGTDIVRITFLRPNVTSSLIQFLVDLKR